MNVRVDQVVQFDARGVASLRRRVLGREVVHDSLGDDDDVTGRVIGGPPSVSREEGDTNHQEVEHRLAQKGSNAHTV